MQLTAINEICHPLRVSMNLSRRLPVYLLIDCSESMAGAAFEAVQSGLHTLVNELNGDPTALESVWLSVITFSGRARVLVPLTELTQFQPPRLILGSGTSLGVALDLLIQRLNSEVRVQTLERKGDWKPLVFIMTDGDPTDTWFKTADLFRREVAERRANVVAIACGPSVNHTNLQRIAPSVLKFKDPREPSFKDFFKWVSQSVQTASAKFASGRESGNTLPDLPNTMELVVEGVQMPAPNQVFVLARCVRGAQLYLMRYEQIPEEVLEELRRTKGLDIPRGQDFFCGVASHPLPDFDLEGSKENLRLTVSSDALVASKPCPHCGNECWARCGACDQIFCLSGAGTHQCPWCRKAGNYTPGSFDVGRGLG